MCGNCVWRVCSTGQRNCGRDGRDQTVAQRFRGATAHRRVHATAAAADFDDNHIHRVQTGSAGQYTSTFVRWKSNR